MTLPDLANRPPYTPPDHATLIPGFPGWHMIGTLLFTPEGRIVFRNHPRGLYPKARTFRSVDHAAAWLGTIGITSSLRNADAAAYASRPVR
jgi:hypothetical protein